MLKAKFEKKWDYGTPNKENNVDNRDWFRWIRFVNIAVAEHGKGTQILTEWGEKGNLYGYSQVVRDEAGTPYPGADRVVHVGGVQEEVEKAEIEDWKIETHPVLFEIAMRVIKWIELQEEKQHEKERRILEALEY